LAKSGQKSHKKSDEPRAVFMSMSHEVASIPPNLESKSGATFSQFGAEVPSISDLSFFFYFGFFPLGKKFC